MAMSPIQIFHYVIALQPDLSRPVSDPTSTLQRNDLRAYFLLSIQTTLACGSSVALMRAAPGALSPFQAFLMLYCPAEPKSDKRRSRVMVFSPRLNAATACTSPGKSALQITRSPSCNICRDAVA